MGRRRSRYRIDKEREKSDLNGRMYEKRKSNRRGRLYEARRFKGRQGRGKKEYKKNGSVYIQVNEARIGERDEALVLRKR